MIAPRIEAVGQSFENSNPVMDNLRRVPMHRAFGAGDRATKDLADALVSKADAENGKVAGKLPHNVERLSCLMRRAGSGRNHNRLGLEVRLINRIIALHHNLLAKLFKIARDVVNKAVVIIDNQDHGAKASMMRVILVSVSSNSAAGSERAVMPPPPWNRAVPCVTIAVRMAMFQSPW